MNISRDDKSALLHTCNACVNAGLALVYVISSLEQKHGIHIECTLAKDVHTHAMLLAHELGIDILYVNACDALVILTDEDRAKVIDQVS